MVTAEFERLAHQVAAHQGHKGLRVLVLPYPLEGRPVDELVDIAVASYPALIEALGAGPVPS